MTDVLTVPFKITGVDGKETEIAIPRDAVIAAISDTHLPKDRIESELNRRVQGIIKNQGLRKPEELLDDEAFATQIAEKHGFKKIEGDGGSAAASQQLRDAIAKAVADIELKRIKPLEEKLTAKEAREEQLLDRDLQRAILQAAAGRARKALLKSPGKGKPAPIVAMLTDVFGYDEDTSEFYVADGENFVLSTRQDGDSTFKTVDEYVTDWLALPENADFAEPAQGGPNVGAAGSGRAAVAGVIVLTPEQANDHATYQDALKKVGGDHSKIRVARPGAHV